MNHLIFILKTVGISFPISSLFGVLAGLFWTMNSVSHPHQMFPNWIITLVLAASTSLLFGVVIGGLLSFLDKADLKKSLLYTNGIVLVLLIALLIFVIKQ